MMQFSGSATHNALLRAEARAIGTLERYPWIGWACWIAFCVLALAQTSPRRFGATFDVYLNSAANFFNGAPIYDFSRLSEYLYWPVSLIVFRPVLGFEPTTAAMIVLTVSAALLSWASYELLKSMFPEPPPIGAPMLAGILLMINIPACWYNFKYIQAQIPMTAGMMLAAAAIARTQWIKGSFWLFVSVVAKPLSLVMLLLCAATRPRMMLPLGIVLAACLALPFAFADAHYVAGEYRAWIMKLQQISSTVPQQWPYQADFATMLDTFGVVVPPALGTGIRLAAAFGILGLVWRIARTQDSRTFAIAVTLLGGCYITLFGPRNEFLSFLVLTPPLTALALFMLTRDAQDQRAWALIGAVLVIGFHGALGFDRVAKPFLVSLILIWLIRLTIDPARLRALMGAPVRS